MDSNGTPATDIVAEGSVRANGDGRTCARATVLDTVNDVAVCSCRKAGLESRGPALVGVVDDHKPCLSSPESDTLGRWGDPVGDIRGLDSVPKTNHSGDGGPAMLAIPAVSATIAVAGAGVSVGSARITVAELVAGKNSGGPEGMCQDPHMGKCVHVVCGGGCQCLAITFGIMVDDEGVGGTTVTGRIAIGLWATKGSDAIALEGGLEGESVLEGLGLTKSCIFARSNSGPATVVDLLSDIGGCPGQAINDYPKVVNGNVFGSVDAEAVGSQTQEIVGKIDELAADVLAFRGQVGEVGELTVPDLLGIVKVLDVIAGGTTVMEVLRLVNSRIFVVRETRSCNTSTVIQAGHVVEDDINEDLDAGCMAGIDHVLVLLAATTFGLELVADDLVVGPPLAALDVFCHWVDLNVAVSGGTDKVSAFIGD